MKIIFLFVMQTIITINQINQINGSTSVPIKQTYKLCQGNTQLQLSSVVSEWMKIPGSPFINLPFGTNTVDGYPTQCNYSNGWIEYEKFVAGVNDGGTYQLSEFNPSTNQLYYVEIKHYNGSTYGPSIYLSSTSYTLNGSILQLIPSNLLNVNDILLVEWFLQPQHN